MPPRAIALSLTAIAVVLALVACDSAAGNEPLAEATLRPSLPPTETAVPTTGDTTPTTGTPTPEPSPTSTPIALNAEPPPIDQITLDYVQRVIDAHDEVYGDARRLIVAAGEYTSEADAMTAAVSGPAVLEGERRAWQIELQQYPGLGYYRDTPGNTVSRVQEITDRRPGCVAVRTTADRTAVFDPNPPDFVTIKNSGYLILARSDMADDPANRNPTLWVRAGSISAERISAEEAKTLCDRL